MIRRAGLTLAAWALWASGVHAEPPSAPANTARYARELQAELTAMQRQPRCQPETHGRFHCSFAATGATSGGHGSTLHAVYSDQTDTVYVYVERYAMLPADDARTPTLLRRMMELNWQLLVGKLEWSARSGEVRLSAVLNTDSNFDRRALRSIVLSLETVAERYRQELASRP